MEEETKLQTKNLLAENQSRYQRKSSKNLPLDPGGEAPAVESEVEVVILHHISFITLCIHELWAALQR